MSLRPYLEGIFKDQWTGSFLGLLEASVSISDLRLKISVSKNFLGFF